MPPTASAAAQPITLGGKEYVMSPLSMKDIDELSGWLRSQFLRKVKEAIPKELPEEDQRDMLGAAMQEAVALTAFSKAGAREMRSVAGIARVVWQGLLARHPGVTHEEVLDLLKGNPMDAMTAMLVFEELNIGKRKKEDKPPEGAPKAQ